jgi:serine/threonine protein phosphatase PrpC
MHEAKNTQRALVRIGYDGRVFKEFRGPKALERFENECRVLEYLALRGCNFVPRIISTNKETLELVTTNCGALVAQLSEAKVAKIFARLRKYGVRHDDAFLRNITYRSTDGQFCVIDFEFATILEPEHTSAEKPVDPSELATSPTSVAWSGYSHRGRVRPNNEDAFLAMVFSERGIQYLGKEGSGPILGNDYIFAVSDGMGGEKSGEFASKISIEKITVMLPQSFRLPADDFQRQAPRILQELFVSIHDAMTRLSRTDIHCRDMGATLTLVWLRGGTCYYAHLGDSRLYIKRADESMRQLSDDHSHVGWLRRQGELNERQARSHPRRNVLAQALGAGHKFVNPQVGKLEMSIGDQFVLVTDGIVDGLWDRGIEAVVSTDPSSHDEATVAQRLVESAMELSRDNATAIVLRV